MMLLMILLVALVGVADVADVVFVMQSSFEDCLVHVYVVQLWTN